MAAGRRRRRAASTGMALVLMIGVAAGPATGDDAVVRIGDWTMNAAEITAEFSWSPPALLNQVRRSDNSARLLAVEWYSNALIAKAVASDKQLASKLPGLEAAGNTLRNKMIAGRAVQQYVKDKFAPDEAELKQFVDMNEELCRAQPRYRIASIGVVVAKKAGEQELQGAQARIDDVKKRLAAGESFATLADEKSDLNTKGPGGEAGWLTQEELDRTEGKEAITTLKKEQVSEVVRTSEAFVVFKLLDREEARTLPFEECRATAEKVMNERYRAQIAREWIDEIAKKYDASLNMDAFVAAVRAVPLDKDWLEKEAAKSGLQTDVR